MAGKLLLRINGLTRSVPSLMRSKLLETLRVLYPQRSIVHYGGCLILPRHRPNGQLLCNLSAALRNSPLNRRWPKVLPDSQLTAAPLVEPPQLRENPRSLPELGSVPEVAQDRSPIPHGMPLSAWVILGHPVLSYANAITLRRLRTPNVVMLTHS